VKYLPPELFDISCMVPLFDKPVQYQPIYINNTKQPINNVFIILSHPNPITRGQIIDSCINAINGKKALFVCIGGCIGKNTIKTSVLIKKYLTRCGVPNKDIVIQEFDKYPNCITEALLHINIILQKQTQIFIAVNKERIHDVLVYIKKCKVIQKIRFICN
jgi:hypothetical protein